MSRRWRASAADARTVASCLLHGELEIEIVVASVASLAFWGASIQNPYSATLVAQHAWQPTQVIGWEHEDELPLAVCQSANTVRQLLLVDLDGLRCIRMDDQHRWPMAA
jgi:hypothetical protein